MAPHDTHLTVAVLLVPPVQLMDMAPVDMFFMLSKSFLTDCQMPQPIIDRGIDNVNVFYVADTSESADDSSPYLAELTSCANVKITHDVSSPALVPGKIDIILVPGPKPSTQVPEPVKTFLRTHANANTHILSICTGAFVLGQAGILDGKSCTGPRPLVGMRLVKEFPLAKWVEKRWEVDSTGTLWTAGGITNGQDMIAAYLRHRFSSELADLVMSLADVGARKQEYESSSASDGLWFGWILMRGVFKGRLGSRVKGASESSST